MHQADIIQAEPTVKEAKEYLRANFNTGVSCPCCGQFVKRYKRRITASAAIGLIKLYKLSQKINPEMYFHLNEIFSTGHWGGDFSKLPAWGLTEVKPNID